MHYSRKISNQAMAKREGLAEINSCIEVDFLMFDTCTKLSVGKINLHIFVLGDLSDVT